MLLAVLILVPCVGIGTIGYHWLGDLSWVDAFLNASMILGGMGPVDRMTTDTAKLFSAFYALFSGIVLNVAPLFWSSIVPPVARRDPPQICSELPRSTTYSGTR